MIKSSLEIQINELMDNFKKIDLNDQASIIAWFYQATNCPMIFEKDEYRVFIISELEKNSYKPINTPEEELMNFNKLMHANNEENIDDILNRLIVYTLTVIKKYKKMEPSLIFILEVYNERYNKVNTYSNMMEQLRKKINEKVIYILVQDGKKNLKTGILTNVIDYKSITIDDEIIPFIGYNNGVSLVSDEDGKVLYSNLYISSGYNLKDQNEVNKLTTKCFGNFH